MICFAFMHFSRTITVLHSELKNYAPGDILSNLSEIHLEPAAGWLVKPALHADRPH